MSSANSTVTQRIVNCRRHRRHSPSAMKALDLLERCLGDEVKVVVFRRESEMLAFQRVALFCGADIECVLLCSDLMFPCGEVYYVE